MRARARSRGILPRAFLALALLAGGVAAWLLWPFWSLSLTFGDHAWVEPSRIYARPVRLRTGEAMTPESLEELLADLDYRRASGQFPAPGEYALAGDRWIVHRRRFPTSAGSEPPGLLEIRSDQRGIRSLSLSGARIREASLDPPVLASLFGSGREELRPVRLDDLPEDLVQAVLAAEDAGFFRHAGVSIRGVMRAVWSNVRDEGPLQGGSTLTQQLVKNLYLSHERTLARKAREAVLAVLIELRYEKREVLEAYLNEVYWGRSGGVNLVGVGAAAHAYFGKEAAHLSLAESATLAGIIQAPNQLSPTRHPERAQARRDRVLERMRQLEWIDDEQYQAAIAPALEVRAYTGARRRAPHFVDRVLEEVAARFGVDAARTAGLSILTTLDWRDQRAAETAVERGLESLDRGWREAEGARPLEAALVSVAPDSGAIRAWIGGRNYAASQFDRAGQGRRQAGSAFKPVVYAAALSRGMVTPASMIPDEPLSVRIAGVAWEPQNDDREFRGWVSVRGALEQSLNVPTARLALETGLDRVLAMARDLGIGGRLEPYPSLALGAFEVAPVELASVYATLAAGGVRPPIHAVEGVRSSDGTPLPGAGLGSAERVLAAPVAYLLTSLLQGVVDRGTASDLRAEGLADPVAGKTGTTNGRRDSWFAGYSPERATVVWVGYDDNRETGLSGSRAALPIWARFSAAVRPPDGYEPFRRPAGVVSAEVDPETGLLATAGCPTAQLEVFLEGQAPWRPCYLHERAELAVSGVPRVTAGETVLEERPAERRRPWWKRLFGGKRKVRDDGDG
jgi:penicillin-binding protein 1B